MNLKKIASLSAPVSGAFDFQGLDLTPYESVFIYVVGLTGDTDNIRPRVQFGVGGGTLVTSYRLGSTAISSSNTTLTSNDTSEAYFYLTPKGGTNWNIGNGAGECGLFEVILGRPQSSQYKRVMHRGAYDLPSGNFSFIEGGAVVESTGLIDRIYITPHTGNFSAGKAIIFGFGGPTSDWEALGTKLSSPTAGAFAYDSQDFSPDLVKLIAAGVTVDTNDAIVRLTADIGGVEIVTGYRAVSRTRNGSGSAGTYTSGSLVDVAAFPLNNESNPHDVGYPLGVDLLMGAPTNGLYKKFLWQTLSGPSGDASWTRGGGTLRNTGVLNGLNLFATQSFDAGRTQMLSASA